MKTIIKNALIVNEGKTFKGSVLINDEIIDLVSSENIDCHADNVIDAEGLLLIPGAIDDQVHFREPGLTHKGDIYTESKSGIAGGVTSFMEMPNTVPQTVNVQLLEEKYKRASEVSLANYSFYIGATNDNLDEVLKTNPSQVCGIKCFMGSSTGNMLVEGTGLENLFRNAHMLVATHNEEEDIIKANIEIYKNKFGENVPVKYHPEIRSAEACFESSRKAVELASKYSTRLHILHLSTEMEMDLFTNDDVTTKNITNEVCVHHLWFDESDYEKYGSKIKWNPSIKKISDRDALREAVNSGKIDIVATDHAPHTLDEKNNTYFKCPSGGPLLQHSLQAMLEMASKGIFTYEKVIEKMCHLPAVLFSIPDRGFIRQGYKADLVLVDPNSHFKVTANNILYKCGWSPFEGQVFKHSIKKTWVNGNLVYDNGIFNEDIKGQRLRFNR